MKRVLVYCLAGVVSLVLLSVIVYVKGHEPVPYREATRFLANARSSESNVDLLKKVLQQVNVQNPTKDANAALRRGDCSFLAVCGYACLIVGLDFTHPEKIESFTSTCGARTIDGTSDLIESDEHGRLQEVVTVYAAKYNSYVYNTMEKHEHSIYGGYLEAMSYSRRAFRKAMEP